MKIIHQAVYLTPGSLFPEDQTVTLSAYAIAEAVEKAPRYAYQFTLHDVEVRTGIIEDEVIENRKIVNRSGKFFLGGEIFTLSDVKGWGREFSILAGNMECNGWPKVIKCRTGNFQPFEDGDVVVGATRELAGASPRQLERK